MQNPDKIPQLIEKYNKMYPPEDVAEEEPQKVYTEEEIAELSRLTNGETDPEEVAYYMQNPDKVPQLVAKYEAMKAEAEEEPKPEDEPAPEEEAAPEDEATPEASNDEDPEVADESEPAVDAHIDASVSQEIVEDDSAALEKKLEEFSKRAEGYRPADTFEGESERAKSSNHFDYHPRVRGENAEKYSRHAQWERLVREKSAESPKLREIHEDGSDETNAEWLARVGIPTLEEFMRDGEEEAPQAEVVEEEPKVNWSEMSRSEKMTFVRENPRNPGEKTDAWAKRIGIRTSKQEAQPKPVVAEAPKAEAEPVVETPKMAPESNEKREVGREAIMEELAKKEAQLWAVGKFEIGKLESMSDDELEDAYKDYEQYMQAREELLAQFGDRGFNEWLHDELDLTNGEIEMMTNDELEDLIAEYTEENADDEEELIAAEGGDKDAAEKPIDDDDLSVAVPYSGEPIRISSELTRVYPSDADIDDAASKVGITVTPLDRTRIRKALSTWNTMGSEVRRRLLDGRGAIEHRTAADYGEDAEDGTKNIDAAKTLEQFGLIKIAAEVTGE